jgi:hypothetical protein
MTHTLAPIIWPHGFQTDQALINDLGQQQYCMPDFLLFLVLTFVPNFASVHSGNTIHIVAVMFQSFS